jgi:NAD(P)-dependent dehydrogenase (short-subunit alcohol dehydrogenase family)
MARLKNKQILVTGGAQGIGAGIVEVLIEEGADVAIVDRQFEKAQELACRLSTKGRTVIAIAADISVREDCGNAVSEAVTRLGGLDCLVNNAAPGRNKSYIGQLSDVDWEDHVNVVLQAPVWLSEFGKPHLQKSTAGAIVNISSVLASKVAPNQGGWPYHVTKAGLDQLTRYLACKFGKHNIRVNGVSPGLVDREGAVKISDFPKNLQIIEDVVPLRRAGTAREIGKTVSYLCSEDAAYLTGQILVVDGGLELMEVFGSALAAVDTYGT